MIIPDVNILIYAHNTAVPEHDLARHWWESALNGTEQIGLDWAVLLGFVRLLSHPAVVERPHSPGELLKRVDAILAVPATRLLVPGKQHAAEMHKLFDHSGAGHRMTTDVHLAALALQLDATLATNDADFARFPGLKTINPLLVN